MNRTLYLIIFLVLLSLHVDAQEAKFKFSRSSIKIDLSEDIIDEAESKGITDDRIYVTFTMTAKCEVIDFKISKQAKLKSFNLLVENDKEKIIQQLKKTFECNGEKENKFQTPIVIHISH
jgi:hypothetical protein